MKRVLIFAFCLIAFGLVAQVIYQPHRRNAFRSKVFQPSDVAGLVMWYDANSIGSPTNVNGYFITNWYDRSVNGYTLTNAEAGFQPYYTNNVSRIGGKPWLKFTGTNYLRHLSGSFAQPNTIFVVGYHVNNGSYQTLVDGTDATHYNSIRPNTASIYVNAGTSVNTTPVVVNQWYLYEVTFNGASSAVYTNGVAMPALSGSPGTFPLNGLTVGWTALKNFYPCVSGIAEILVYNADVSSPNRTLIQGYFTNKYGAFSTW